MAGGGRRRYPGAGGDGEGMSIGVGKNNLCPGDGIPLGHRFV